MPSGPCPASSSSPSSRSSRWPWPSISPSPAGTAWATRSRSGLDNWKKLLDDRPDDPVPVAHRPSDGGQLGLPDGRSRCCSASGRRAGSGTGRCSRDLLRAVPALLDRHLGALLRPARPELRHHPEGHPGLVQRRVPRDRVRRRLAVHPLPHPDLPGRGPADSPKSCTRPRQSTGRAATASSSRSRSRSCATRSRRPPC